MQLFTSLSSGSCKQEQAAQMQEYVDDVIWFPRFLNGESGTEEALYNRTQSFFVMLPNVRQTQVGSCWHDPACFPPNVLHSYGDTLTFACTGEGRMYM